MSKSLLFQHLVQEFMNLLKIKVESDSTYKYLISNYDSLVKQISMRVMWIMNVIFVTDFPTKEIKYKLNVISNNSQNISGENFAKHFFSTFKAHKNQTHNKINSTSFQVFASCKSRNLTLAKINSHQEAFTLVSKNVLRSWDSIKKETKLLC